MHVRQALHQLNFILSLRLTFFNSFQNVDFYLELKRSIFFYQKGYYPFALSPVCSAYQDDDVTAQGQG